MRFTFQVICIFFIIIILNDSYAISFKDEMPIKMERPKKHKAIPITECLKFISEKGHYMYKVGWIKETYNNANHVCGLYITAKPNELIRVYVTMNAPCKDDSLIAFVDGWEYKGSYFPSDEDYNKNVNERVEEYCDTNEFMVQSSQNAAQIMFRIKQPGNGFNLYYSTIKNPTPCNVLINSLDEAYILRNYGLRNNCSLSMPFSSGMNLKVTSLTVGVKGSKKLSDIEIGTFHDCNRRGMEDYVQIGSGDQIGKVTKVSDVLCGVDFKSNIYESDILCNYPIVRLVSSGATENRVVVRVKSPKEKHRNKAIICPINEEGK